MTDAIPATLRNGMRLTVAEAQQWRNESVSGDEARRRFGIICDSYIELATAQAAFEKLPLSARELKMKNAIAAHIERYGIAPTYADLARYMGLQSRGSVHVVVTSMVRKGHLIKHDGRKRALKIVP